MKNAEIMDSGGKIDLSSIKNAKNMDSDTGRP